MTRALLEGMARAFHAGFTNIQQTLNANCARLVGAGNGLRENHVLSRIIADEFDLPMKFTRHREEAAFGAALLATVGAGIFPDLAAAGKLIRYE